MIVFPRSVNLARGASGPPRPFRCIHAAIRRMLASYMTYARFRYRRLPSMHTRVIHIAIRRMRSSEKRKTPSMQTANRNRLSRADRSRANDAECVDATGSGCTTSAILPVHERQPPNDVRRPLSRRPRELKWRGTAADAASGGSSTTDRHRGPPPQRPLHRHHVAGPPNAYVAC